MIAGMIILHRAQLRLPLGAFTALLLASALSACVYRMNIQQGNYLEGKTVDQLQVGMTRSQVRYLLGTPLVPVAAQRPVQLDAMAVRAHIGARARFAEDTYGG